MLDTVQILYAPRTAITVPQLSLVVHRPSSKIDHPQRSITLKDRPQGADGPRVKALDYVESRCYGPEAENL